MSSTVPPFASHVTRHNEYVRVENDAEIIFYYTDGPFRQNRDMIAFNKATHAVREKRINKMLATGTYAVSDPVGGNHVQAYVSYDENARIEQIHEISKDDASTWRIIPSAPYLVTCDQKGKISPVDSLADHVNFRLLQTNSYDQAGALLSSEFFNRGKKIKEIHYQDWQEAKTVMFDRAHRTASIIEGSKQVHFKNATNPDWAEPYGLCYNLPFDPRAAMLQIAQLEHITFKRYYDGDGYLLDGEWIFSNPDGEISGYTAYIRDRRQKTGYGQILSYNAETLRLTNARQGCFVQNRSDLRLDQATREIYRQNDKITFGMK